MRFAWVLPVIVVLVVSAAFITAINHTYMRYEKEVENFDSFLEKSGWQVQIATIESPAVIIDFETQEDFIEKCWELNATVIYKDKLLNHVWYFVFSEDMQIAFRYVFVVGET